MADKGRREDVVFFIYDHHVLKKEEDDPKDAILYFHPENTSLDDQCALCGQLMGMTQFLGATLSKAAPQVFKFDHEKFILKLVGSYSLGLKCGSYSPDNLMINNLNMLYDTFVTYHGSIDSVRLRYKDSHESFLQELCNIWRTILSSSGVCLGASLQQTFHPVPYVNLPKSGSHLFLQASHLLQSCQRRPYILAGTILYKNGVFCTQLPPKLTKHLTFLQNQMPHITRKTDFDLPVGCRIVTVFLRDAEFMEISSLDSLSRRHCKMTDFTARRDSASFIRDKHHSNGKLLSRRLTCPNLSSYSPKSKSSPVSDKALHIYLTNEQRRAYHSNKDSMGVEESTWGKKKSKVSLSHMPIVECKSGESGAESGTEILGHAAQDAHFGGTYEQIDQSGKLLSCDGEASEETSAEESLEEKQSQQPIKSSELQPQSDQPIKSSELQPPLSEPMKSSEIQPQSDQPIKTSDRAHQNTKPIKVLNEMDPSISDLEDEELDENLKSRSKELDSKELDEHNEIEIQTDELILSKNSNGANKLKENLIDSDSQTQTINLESGQKLLTHKVEIHREDSVTSNELSGTSISTVNQGVEVKTNIACEDTHHANVMKVSDSRDIVIGDKCLKDSKMEEITSARSENSGDDSQGLITNTITNFSEKCANVQIKQEETVAIVSESEHTITAQATKGITEISKEKENINPNIGVDKDQLILDIPKVEYYETETEDESIIEEQFIPCINCLELASKQASTSQNRTIKCSQCLNKPSTRRVVSRNGNQSEVFDFGRKNYESGTDTEGVFSDTEQGTSFAVASSDTIEDGNDTATQQAVLTGPSSFSSDVSTDSTISRYWTHEMEGLNDVVLYVQCHSDISLLLLMENPEQYQENLLHSLWKGSLAQLADLDYYIKECLEHDHHDFKVLDNHQYTHFDQYSQGLTGNIPVDDKSTSKKDDLFQQSLATLHAEFTQGQCLTDVLLRSQSLCCYGHRSHGDETYFHLEGQQRLMSGLPLPNDAAFTLDNVAKQCIAKHKKQSLL